MINTIAGTQTDCKDIYNNGDISSGVYNITNSAGDNVAVYCDMDLPGGGWTVIQRRVSDTVSFNRNWTDYKDGFGDLEANHWLGLDKIHDIVSKPSTTFELYIDMEIYHPFPETNMVTAFALYQSFSVAGEMNNYRLTIGVLDGSSTAGDSLVDHNQMEFSTPDRDNDISLTAHCAQRFSAGWWFRNCRVSLLNGRYYDMGDQGDAQDGIIWETWAGENKDSSTLRWQSDQLDVRVFKIYYMYVGIEY